MTQSINRTLRNLGLAAALGFAFVTLPAASSAEAGHRHAQAHKHWKHHGSAFAHRPFHHRSFAHSRFHHRPKVVIRKHPPVHFHRPKGFVFGYVPVHPAWRPAPHGAIRHPGYFHGYYR